MFSTLSRGSSKVRQTYICSACRCNILAHTNPQQTHLPGSGTTPGASHDFSTSASQLQAKNGEPSTAEPATGGGSKYSPRERQEDMERHTSRTPLSKSMSTLRALRESLLAEPIPPPPRRKPLANEKQPLKGSSKTPSIAPAKSPLKGKGARTLKMTNSRQSSSSQVSETLKVAADPPVVVVQQKGTIEAEDNDTGDVSANPTRAGGKKNLGTQRRARAKARGKAQLNQVAKVEAKAEALDAAPDGEGIDVPEGFLIEKKPGKPSKKEATKTPKAKKSTSKLTLPKVSPKPKMSSKPAADSETTTPGQHTRSWTVIGEDGRKFIVRLDDSGKNKTAKEKAAKEGKPKNAASNQNTVTVKPTAVEKPDLVNTDECKQGKENFGRMTAKFFADHPTIRAKLKDIPVTAGTTLLRNRLKELLQGDQLSEAERLPALRKLIGLRVHGRTAPVARPVRTLTVRKCRTNSTIIEKQDADQKRPKSVRAQPGTTAHEIKTVDANSLQLVPLDTGRLQVPQLSYGLERVLFNPGVYQLQDPRSRVFNFDPYLQTIMPVSEFDFNALKQYITSSRDKNLLSKAIAEKKKYTGSTSSMTSALAHFHFLLSQWREITFSNLSKMFPVEFKSFTAIQRSPVSIFLRWRDGAYAIDADKQFDSANILMSLGKSMEKLLTLPTEDFEKYRKSNSDQITEEERNASEEFHYTGIGDFLLRSQLDAYDSRLPGTGMFDLKTRAVISVRMDTDAYEDGRGYEIRGQHGEWESFEREYYDMIRSAFLKYSLQVRMGRMDGIFVAYHNTERIFGFQYISLPELDFALHGTTDTTLGDQEFKLSLDLLNRVLDRATAKYPKQSLRIVIETRPGKTTPFTYIFAEPFTEQAIEDIQNSSKAKIEKFEKAVLGVVSKEYSEEDQQKEWEKIRAGVEESVGDDEAGREASGNDDVSDLDSDLDNTEEDGDLAENEDGSDDADELPEEARELADIISATSLVEDKASKGDGDELIGEGDIADAKDTDLEGSVGEESEDSEATGTEESLFEPDEVEPAESDEIVEADSDTPDEDFEVEHAEEASGASDPDDTDSIIDEDTLPIARVPPSGKGLSAKEKVKEKAIPREMIAMTLTIRNKVNGEYTTRPENLRSTDKWEVEHALSEIQDPQRIATLYKMCLERRSWSVSKTIDLNKTSFNNMFLQRIKNMNQKGREWRKQQSELDKTQPVKVLDVKDGKKISEKDLGLWTQEEDKVEEKD